MNGLSEWDPPLTPTRSTLFYIDFHSRALWLWALLQSQLAGFSIDYRQRKKTGGRPYKVAMARALIQTLLNETFSYRLFDIGKTFFFIFRTTIAGHNNNMCPVRGLYLQVVLIAYFDSGPKPPKNGIQCGGQKCGRIPTAPTNTSEWTLGRRATCLGRVWEAEFSVQEIIIRKME